ncbi:MMPL family transporter [Mycobacterium bourgelatii]|uniref:MMPL family transporter n=1 Tax=Mycobacterium bourgelatii TaxID=1273442 RepID=UPI0023DDF92A|nr:MMPL family transporter [Mycobacterium bourgelatii]
MAAWIAVAVVTNVLLALTSTKADAGSALVPHDAQTAAATARIAQAFPGTGTDAIAYLVLDGRDTLGPADQRYYDAAVSALRADTAHVGAVVDWWSDPLTAPMGTSADGRSGVAMLWLKGQAGTAQARESLAAARSVVSKLPPTSGLRARITVPATTTSMPLRMNAWQGAAIAVAAAVGAVLLVLLARRSLVGAGITLLTIGVSLAVAWPLIVVTRFALLSPFAVTLAAVLAMGTITASALLVGRRAMALPGVGVAMLTAPMLLARTPALHSVGISALSVIVALATSLTLLPSLRGLAGVQDPPEQAPAPAGGLVSRLSAPRAAVATALALAICALPLLGLRWGVADNPPLTNRAQFVPGTSLPDVIVFKADQDLRDPAGLIAIDKVSHRLMEIPGVRRVQSAAWPGGVPWTDASLASAAGRLGEQLDRQAVTFVPQVNAIKTLASVVDQVSGAVDQVETTLNAGLGGLSELQRAINVVLSGTRDIKDTTVEVSGYLDPIRDWTGGVQNCPADALCSAARKVMDPLDRVVNDVRVLSDGADRIAGVSARTVNVFATTPQAVAQMRSALDQLRSFVPTLERTVEETIPQVVQLSAFLKNLSIDFADTGEGGFYLSRKALADPSYQNVRKWMFSADGTATRLFVYSDGTRLDLSAATRGQQFDAAIESTTKYGSLLDSQLSLGGAAAMAASVRSALVHDGVLLGATLLAVAAVVGAWRGAVTGVGVGLGVLAAGLAALGVSAFVLQTLLHRDLHVSVALVSFVVLAACGIPYLVAVPARRAVAPLAGVGVIFGVGLVAVSGGVSSALGQLGVVLLIGLTALAAVAHVGLAAWRPVPVTAPASPASPAEPTTD